MSMDEGYSGVKAVVERFKALSRTARQHFNEQNTRKDFILPLFRALQWDVYNSAEVSAEDKVSRGWVDFAFRLGGVPRFFLETKAIREDLSKEVWVKQAIDYAWTKSVTWAVLSDFEGLRVFNAEWQEDDAQRAQFIEFSIDSYLSDFERLWWLSRPETLAGRLDREAEKWGKKVKREPVSQHLFDDLRSWRSELFSHLRVYNKQWSPAQIDEAVLVLLNRLIFIRATEDRAVEPLRLQPLLRMLLLEKRRQSLLPELRKLFREFDATYNSELFAAHRVDVLDSDPEPFETLINGLYGRQSTLYNFNAIDADVLGTAYEQYLGHVVAEPDAAEAVDKRAKRKSQGIYYTPGFVVKYIVQQTLGRRLREDGFNESKPVRILDMACGSGSFLIEAFDVLDRFVAQQSGDASAAYDLHDHARQMQLLTQCIFGVDKDEQAVAVARLNLLLKALYTRDKLPMLGNIRCGDSLISGAADDLKAAFGPGWRSKKPFNWAEQFPEVMQQGGFDVIIGNPPYIRAENMPRDERDYYMLVGRFDVAYGRFDIHILFLERGLKLLKADGGRLGFIVPFSMLYQNYGEKLRQFILDTCVIETIVDFSKFKVFEDANVDTCILILRKEEDIRVRQNNEIQVISQADYSTGINTAPSLIPQSAFRHTPGQMFRLELAGAALDLVKKIDGLSLKLGAICYCVIGAVPHDSKTGQSKDSLIFKCATTDTCKPYIEGKELTRYALNWQSRYLAYEPTRMHRAKFPELFESAKLIVRNISGAEGLIATFDQKGFYANDTVSLCVKWESLEGVKADLNVRKPEAPSDAARYDLRYLLGLVNSRMVNRYFWLSLGGGLHVYPELVRNLPIRLINFSDPADKARHDQMVTMVDEMLALQKEYAVAERDKEGSRHELKGRIDRLDAAIDRQVYELYGLSDEEIKIVEGGDG